MGLSSRDSRAKVLKNRPEKKSLNLGSQLGLVSLRIPGLGIRLGINIQVQFRVKLKSNFDLPNPGCKCESIVYQAGELK
jgi:hypothetical protein